MGKLKGKVAVVTGGNSGIGLATAQRFATEGAYVFITGRRQLALDVAVKQIGENVTGVQGDVSNLADLDRLYSSVKQQKGRIDILFANAGSGEFVPLGAITEEHFDKTFNIKCQRPTLHGAKGASVDPGRRRNHSERGDRFHQRDAGVQRLQRHEGRRTIFCAHLVSRFERAQDSRQCPEPRPD